MVRTHLPLFTNRYPAIHLTISNAVQMKNIGTMLIVAHRLSTIQHADNIILLSKGKIICGVMGEIIGTGNIGAVISYPVMTFLWCRGR